MTRFSHQSDKSKGHFLQIFTKENKETKTWLGEHLNSYRGSPAEKLPKLAAWSPKSELRLYAKTAGAGKRFSGSAARDARRSDTRHS